MDIAQLILLSLLSLLLLLVVLNIVFYVWSKITLIFLIVSHLVTFKLKPLKKWILNLFGKKSEIQSDLMTIDWSDLETLSDSLQAQETAQPTYTPQKSSHRKSSKGISAKSQKRDSRGRFTKA